MVLDYILKSDNVSSEIPWNTRDLYNQQEWEQKQKKIDKKSPASILQSGFLFNCEFVLVYIEI